MTAGNFDDGQQEETSKTITSPNKSNDSTTTDTGKEKGHHTEVHLVIGVPPPYKLAQAPTPEKKNDNRTREEAKDTNTNTNSSTNTNILLTLCRRLCFESILFSPREDGPDTMASSAVFVKYGGRG